MLYEAVSVYQYALIGFAFTFQKIHGPFTASLFMRKRHQQLESISNCSTMRDSTTQPNHRISRNRANSFTKGQAGMCQGYRDHQDISPMHHILRLVDCRASRATIPYPSLTCLATNASPSPSLPYLALSTANPVKHALHI